MKTPQDRLRAMREVAVRADNMHDAARDLGGRAAAGLTRSRRSQVTGLEGTANSALKTSDVFDYITLRIARQRRDEWTQRSWGPDLLTYLSVKLAGERDAICAALKIEQPSIEAVEVHLMLVREFVRQFSAEYEYQCALAAAKQNAGQPQGGGR